MARALITLKVAIDDAWSQLQQLATWEGVAGIEDLREPTYDDTGNLTSFRFAVNTSLGRINGPATVDANRPSMLIRGEQKGLAMTIQIELNNSGPTSSTAVVQASAKSTSFVTKPLAAALNALIETNLDDEAAKIVERVR